MTELATTQMDYDRVSIYFKTAQDGRQLFFPWLFWGRGYVIPSEQDYQRLKRQLRTYKSISLPLIVAAGALLQQHVTALFVVSALAIGVYAALTWHLVDGLESTDEKVSLQECFAFAGAGVRYLYSVVV
jgi:hypothetical protein